MPLLSAQTKCMAAESFSVIAIEAWPDRSVQCTLQLSGMVTLAEALERLKQLRFPPLVARLEQQKIRDPARIERGTVGINGARAAMTYPLQPLDRIEFYRPLQIDPMRARQTKVQMQRKAAARAKQLANEAKQSANEASHAQGGCESAK